MSLILSATLSSSVYFPGDSIYCKVVFSSISPERSATMLQHDTSSPRAVFLADLTPDGPPTDTFNILWASAQVHGNYTVDPTWLKLPATTGTAPKARAGPFGGGSVGLGTAATAATSHAGVMGTSLPNISDLGANGRSIFASPVTILGCEMKVSPSPARTFYYYATLPSSLPPTFKGSGIKYAYYVTIALQVSTRPGQPKSNAHIFNIPVRVLAPAAAIKKIAYPLGHPGFNFAEGCVEIDEEAAAAQTGLHARMNGLNISSSSSTTTTIATTTSSQPNEDDTGKSLDKSRTSSFENDYYSSFSSTTDDGGPLLDDSPLGRRARLGSLSGMSEFSVPIELELSARPDLWHVLVARYRAHKRTPYHKSTTSLTPYPQTPSQHESYHTRHALNTLLNKHSKQVTRHISKGSDRLLTFSIAKSGYTLGETVAGSLTFQHGLVPCHQVSIRLECEETVDSGLLVSRNGKSTTRRVYGELHEYTLYSLQTHFTFYIPIEATPEFSTEQISVQWFLHFEFVTAAAPTPTPLISPMVPRFTSPLGSRKDLSSSFTSSYSPSPSPSPDRDKDKSKDTSPSVPQDPSTTTTSSLEGQRPTLPVAVPLLDTASMSVSSVSTPPPSARSVHHLPSPYSSTPTPIATLMRRYHSSGQGTPLVDTLSWSMPIRVLVLSYPHEPLYNTRNLMRHN
eukprot:TRINITY_DN7427_c0_g1_i5.p1 TRINITY_DN7427_c0_g1~~TRINITY_DN7427_c0_g1_i5.p1  ORF type:complete len:681 (-),score=163.17 TRINITY_DN7427_c0_g1_i5:14-2056(-)